MGKFTAGAASRRITPELGCMLAGQMYPRQAKSVRDDLEVNVFFLSDSSVKLLLVSCDLLWLDRAFMLDVRKEIESRTEVPRGSVVICCTHTHSGPGLIAGLDWMKVDSKYNDRLREALVSAASEAVNSAKPALLGAARGEARIGFNRRLCWEDGSHTMYGDAGKPGFTGIEGPDDPSHAVLYAAGEDGVPIAVVVNNTCHSTCFEGEEFISADYPGEARFLLRRALGERLPVLYLQGAAGDISPRDILAGNAWRKNRVAEIGSILSSSTLNLLRTMKLGAEPVLGIESETMKIGVRTVSEAELKKAKEVVARGPDKDWWEYGRMQSLIKLSADFGRNAFDEVEISAIRAGDLGIATNPCEFYCQFGLDIKRRSPAPITMSVELANGNSGYCPTMSGYLGGGYSGETLYWTRLEPQAGYRIVDTSAKLLHRLWKS